MRYLIYENGRQINAIEADEAFVSAYCQENGFTFEESPLPESEPVDAEPSEADDTASMLVDHEYRLTLLELGLTE